MDPAENISRDLLVKALNVSRDGITIADAQKPGFPLIYVNQGFERLTGHTAAEIIGKNYRIIQRADNDQPEMAAIREAISRGEACVATLRNYRKDGSMFWNELNISPVHAADGSLTHFIGIQKDVTARIELEQQLNVLTYTDPLTGISNRRHFDERFADLLPAAQRIHGALSVLLIDLDHFGLFNERYGQPAGDECLRRVGDCITRSFVRTSDCIARYDGGVFAVVSISSNIDALRNHAYKICAQVRSLNIPHDGSPHKVATVSIGGVHRLPSRDTTEETFTMVAHQELQAAKRGGRNCAYITS